MGKSINVVNEYESVIRKIHSHGINIHGFFIFGFDEDDEDVLQAHRPLCPENAASERSV